MTNLPQAPPVRHECSARAITARSVGLGLVGSVLICAIAPFNDYALANTPFVGNFLPVGLLLLVVVVVLGINAPLSKLCPRWSLRRGELAVALAMCLVSCAVPTSGFMRYVPGTMMAYHLKAVEEPRYAAVIAEANMPWWLFPSFESDEPARRGDEPVARNYISRTPGEREGFLDAVQAVPWADWMVPAISWGVLAVGLFGMGLFLVVILHRQWAVNERLSFPLAGVFASLIEPPEKGRAVGPLFRSIGFWIAASAVFLLHLYNGMSDYVPQYVPKIPISFDLGPFLTEPPLSHLDWYFKRGTILFSIVGIAFFLQTRASFSLWFFVALIQIIVVQSKLAQVEYTAGMRSDQSMGAIVMLAIIIVVVGRRHFGMVVRQMFRGRRPDEPSGEFVSYSIAGWGLVAGCGIVTSWVAAAVIGSGLDHRWAWIEAIAVGVVITAAAIIMMTVVFRAVAETGMPFVQLAFSPTRPWLYLFKWTPWGMKLGPGSYFMTAWFGHALIHDPRETLAPFAGNALHVASESTARSSRSRPLAGIVGLLGVTLVLAYLVSGASMLMVEYNYALTTAAHPLPDLPNRWLMVDSSATMLNGVISYLGDSGSVERHSSGLHLAIGAVMVLVLSLLRLRLAWWPLYPIGYILGFSWAMQVSWFSILIGWGLKSLIVRFGGAPGLAFFRPVFIGLIIGEVMAAATWLVASLVLYALGFDYRAVTLLPT